MRKRKKTLSFMEPFPHRENVEVLQFVIVVDMMVLLLKMNLGLLFVRILILI